MSNNKFLKVVLTGLLLIFFGLAAFIYFTRSRVSTVEKVGEVTLTSEEVAVDDGILRVNINFKSGEVGEAKAIGAVSFRLVYDYSGDEPQFQVVDSEGAPADKVEPNAVLAEASDWSFPVNNVVDRDGKIIIDFAAVNTSTSGYATDASIPIATLYLKHVADTKPSLLLTFDPEYTAMMTKATPPENILSTPGNLELQFE